MYCFTQSNTFVRWHCEDPDGPDYDPDSKVSLTLSKGISLGPEPDDDDKLFLFFVEVKVKLGGFQTRAGNRKMTNFIVSRPLTASNAESKHCPQTNRQNRQVFGSSSMTCCGRSLRMFFPWLCNRLTEDNLFMRKTGLSHSASFHQI